MRYIAVLFVFVLTGCVSPNTGDEYQIECCQQEVNKKDDARARIALGLTYLKNGDYPRAKVNLDKAVELAPYMADSHYSLSYYFKVVGKSERANELYSTARRLEKLKPDIANSYGAYLCQLNRYQEAKDFFQQMIQNANNAKSAEIYENIAICAVKNGYTKEAAEFLQRALEHHPKKLKVLRFLADVYAQEGNFEQAEEILDRIEVNGVVDDNLLWLRMDNARRQGDLTKMQEYGNVLLNIYPHNPLTKNYMMALSELKESDLLKPTQEIQPELMKIQKLSASEFPDGASAATNEQIVSKVTAVSEERADIEGDNRNRLFHIVEKQQNLYRISRLYDTTIARLMELNELSDASKITVGMKLWLVPANERNENLD